MKDLIQDLQKLNIELRINEPLSHHTTYRIGGPAELFALAKTKDELVNLVMLARKHGEKYFVLAGGSNILVSDNGLTGLTIKNQYSELDFQENFIRVSSGYSLAGFIVRCLRENYIGLEFAAGIPGTIGGAIVGNAGAYGRSIGEILEKVEVLDDQNNRIFLSNAELKFSYRHSFLKEVDYIVLDGYFKLPRGDVKQSLEKIRSTITERNQKHPFEPSCGSTFKNIELTPQNLEQFAKADFTIPEQYLKYGKLPTGFIIQELGLKGTKIGQVKISEKHANYLVNVGGAKADEVVQMISYIKQQIRDKIGVQLEEEVRYIGF